MNQNLSIVPQPEQNPDDLANANSLAALGFDETLSADWDWVGQVHEQLKEEQGRTDRMEDTQRWYDLDGYIERLGWILDDHDEIVVGRGLVTLMMVFDTREQMPRIIDLCMRQMRDYANRTPHFMQKITKGGKSLEEVVMSNMLYVIGYDELKEATAKVWRKYLKELQKDREQLNQNDGGENGPFIPSKD